MFGRKKPVDCIQPPIYIDAQRGCNNNNGNNWDEALSTIGAGLKRVRRGGKIVLYGKFLEEGLVTPHGVTDVTIVGHGTRPREGNAGRAGGPKTGAVDWRWANDSTDKPLLHITQQGWRFENLMLRGADKGGCVLLTRTLEAETSDSGFAGDHTTFDGCVFQGPSVFGVCQEGGIAMVHIRNCQFRMFYHEGDYAILGRTGEGVGFPIVWDISNNKFIANYGDINCGIVDSVVRGNIFQRRSVLSSGVPDDVISVDLSAGRGNLVIENWFDMGAFRQGLYDRWHENHFHGDK